LPITDSSELRKTLSPKAVAVSHPSEVAIIGAGPYALSIAAHLRAKGVDFRIFGTPMHSWRTRMPKGMFLKSEGFASSLYDPAGRFTLENFCRQNGAPYKDTTVPVPLETFTEYGLAFQHHLVPGLEDKQVVALDRLPNDVFLLRLDNNETLLSRRVVVAVGISYFSFIPAVLMGLPSKFVSHSSEHHDLSKFKGRDVTVIGAGASALDVAAALDQAGAEVRIVARRASLRWTAPAHRPLWKRWYPKCGLGPGWRNRFYEYAPMVFRHMRPETRLKVVRTWLGPSGAWPVKRQIEQMHLFNGLTPLSTRWHDGRVHLGVVDSCGNEHQLTTDHIIAATGYKVDLCKVTFLNEGLRSMLQCFDGEPVLSANFESSVPGLYFVGLASALTFGPLMRFALGAQYTSRRLAGHLLKPLLSQ
jgi:cation diffusion facilitator CzcD-associated flavoprotein CzcO